MKILSIDRGQHAGGGLQIAEDSGLPGFLHTTHTFSSRGLSTSPWFQEPGLHRWGVTMIAPDPAIASLQRDGRALCWHDDLDRAVASIAQFSRADAGTWRRIASDYAALIRDLIGPEQASPLIAGAERERLLRGHGRTGREYLQLLELSPRQFIETTFEHPSVQAMLLYYCIIREVDVNVTGQGQVIPSYIATRLPGEIVQGGSCALARALKHEIYDHGRHIMEQTTPRRILVRSGRTAGVERDDGRQIRAREFVASSLNPQQTFLELLGQSAVGDGTQTTARGFKYQAAGQIFGVNVALRSAPAYLASESDPAAGTARLTFLGLEDPAAVLQLYEDAQPGRLADQIMPIGGCPTVHDPS